ncbi:MAG: L,D-transpeptidase ErfK/SrfK [Marivirga sp.]|jgi:L,D-transpeptidase ErfK/SrfK
MKNYTKIMSWKVVLPIAMAASLLLAQRVSVWIVTKPTIVMSSLHEDSLAQAYEQEILAIEAQLQKLQPKSNYLVVNSTANEFYLYDRNQLIEQGKCSTGSYILLKNGDLQQWMFKTPKGGYKVLGKTKKPVWKKPDWAFIEEGLPVPSINHPSRFEYGVLGDYSLSLGDGYLIHGTLYQRFIGLPVTHGCIRLNTENLELVYKNLSTGSKVYLF